MDPIRIPEGDRYKDGTDDSVGERYERLPDIDQTCRQRPIAFFEIDESIPKLPLLARQMILFRIKECKFNRDYDGL